MHVLFAALLLLAASSAHAQKSAAQAPAAAGAPSTAPEDVAKQHFQLGRAQYENGQFREAAASFERAYQQAKRDVLWYNIYLAYRDAGATAESATALRNFLERVQEQENRPQLEARLATLERIVAENAARDEAAKKAADAAAAPGKQQAAPTQAPPEALQPDKKEETNIVPYIVMGSGGALIIGGLVVGAMASAKHSELEDKCTENACDPKLQTVADEGQTLALVSDILFFGGIATAATGGVLWFLSLDDSSSDQTAEVSAHLTCGPRACGGRVALAF